jgi:hypothetical protein
MSTKQSNTVPVKGLIVLLVATCSFLVGLMAPTRGIPQASAVPPGQEICSRCRGKSTDGPDNRCIGSVYGGDFCAGTCDELNHCTCREVGECDGYGSGS